MHLIHRIFGLGFVAILAACAASSPAPDTAPSIENFTTEGKPTKTVQTPWGDKQVYDPTQDTEVIAAFEYVYKELPNAPEGQQEQFYKYQDFFSEIAKTQLYDLARIGCKKPLHPEYTELEFSTRIHYTCQDINYRSPTLNICETENINQTGQLKSIIAALKLVGKDNAGNDVWQRNFEGLGLKRHYSTKAEAFDMYFKAECPVFYHNGGE